MRKMLLAALTLCAVSSALAQHRCVENGKTVITNQPCGSEAPAPVPRGNGPKVIGDAANTGYSTPYGDWRGQIQFSASHQAQTIHEAHDVVQATISIDPRGRVEGASPENGCRMKGVATPGGTPLLMQLDVTLSGCRYVAFNRRIFGTLAVIKTQPHAQLNLQIVPIDLLKPGYAYNIRGTMRR